MAVCEGGLVDGPQQLQRSTSRRGFVWLSARSREEWDTCVARRRFCPRGLPAVDARLLNGWLLHVIVGRSYAYAVLGVGLCPHSCLDWHSLRLQPKLRHCKPAHRSSSLGLFAHQVPERLPGMSPEHQSQPIGQTVGVVGILQYYSALAFSFLRAQKGRLPRSSFNYRVRSLSLSFWFLAHEGPEKAVPVLTTGSVHLSMRTTKRGLSSRRPRRPRPETVNIFALKPGEQNLVLNLFDELLFFPSRGAGKHFKSMFLATTNKATSRSASKSRVWATGV